MQFNYMNNINYKIFIFSTFFKFAVNSNNGNNIF